jgi:hypothetical protein
VTAAPTTRSGGVSHRAVAAHAARWTAALFPPLVAALLAVAWQWHPLGSAAVVFTAATVAAVALGAGPDRPGLDAAAWTVLTAGWAGVLVRAVIVGPSSVGAMAAAVGVVGLMFWAAAYLVAVWSWLDRTDLT